MVKLSFALRLKLNGDCIKNKKQITGKETAEKNWNCHITDQTENTYIDFCFFIRTSWHGKGTKFFPKCRFSWQWRVDRWENIPIDHSSPLQTTKNISKNALITHQVTQRRILNGVSFYTYGINAKCKDDKLNAELYRCGWLSNCHLGKFILSLECKLFVLFTLYAFHFLAKFSDTLFHADLSLDSLRQCLLD